MIVFQGSQWVSVIPKALSSIAASEFSCTHLLGLLENAMVVVIMPNITKELLAKSSMIAWKNKGFSA